MIIYIFLSLLFSLQLQKKLHQLEEQLKNEMQAKDELENKCKYDGADNTHKPTDALKVSQSSN